MEEVIPVKKRSYRTIAIQDVKVDDVVAVLGAEHRAMLAIDIAKEKMVFGIASSSGETLKLVRFEHPRQTREFLGVVDGLKQAGVELDIVMEATGSYGDVLCYQMTTRGLAVHFVDPKRCHDASMVFDGVPSQHDPKACTILAQLHARGLSKRYRSRGDDEKRARSLVDRQRLLARPLRQLVGTLEGLVATYWPELMAHIDLSARTRWPLELLATYPGPAAVAADEEGARVLLRRVTRGAMRAARIAEIVAASRHSLGVPVEPAVEQLVQTTVRTMLHLREEIAKVEKEADAFVAEEAAAGVKHVARMIGTMSALAVFADAGDPTAYKAPAALQKALGLNLRERSSGEHKGKLHITKRGSARARQYLYFAAMRFVRDDAVVRAWFAKRCVGGTKVRALVAVMRKLVLALPHVARGKPFDSKKLFDVRRLDLAAPTHDEVAMAN